MSLIVLFDRVLRPALGWRWPLVLLGCLAERRMLFARTRWATAGAPADEARYVRRLALASALYRRLCGRVGQERALGLLRQLLLPIGCAAPRRVLADVTADPATPMDQLMAFHQRMQQSTEGRFNTRVYRTVDATTCHYIITRCVVYDFFSAAGTPELTRLICEVDRVFFAAAFPAFRFTRGAGWDNTIAYGKDHCDFVLTLTPASDVHSHPAQPGRRQ